MALQTIQTNDDSTICPLSHGSTGRRMDKTQGRPHPLAVLVVDDSPDAANSLAELLSLHGHAVAVALGGEAALERLEERVPDVVLLDIRMPGMDGYAVAERIKERCAGGRKRPLLVAVTGCGSEADRARSARVGFDLHLVKPVDPAVLVGMMERFRHLLTPPIPAEELDPPEDDPPDVPVWSRGRKHYALWE
jgi:CheY-like chemotaxis protein